MPIVSTLSVYAIYAGPENSALEQAVASRISPEDSFMLGSGQYLVAFRGTAKDLADHLGITTGAGAEAGPAAPAAVLEVGSFYGSAAPEIWDWLAGKMGAPLSSVNYGPLTHQRV